MTENEYLKLSRELQELAKNIPLNPYYALENNIKFAK
jgi:hypothetical protein